MDQPPFTPHTLSRSNFLRFPCKMISTLSPQLPSNTQTTTPQSRLSNDSVESLFLPSSLLHGYETPHTNPSLNIPSWIVYTMDHVVVPRLCKICDWLLNSSWDHFCSHQGEKRVKVTMEFVVSKSHIVRPTLPTDMVQRVLRWEKQKRCSSFFFKGQRPMAENYCSNTFF